MSSIHHAQGCYVDGQVTGTSVEGSATTSPLPLAIPPAIQPAVIRVRSGSNYTYSVSSALSYWNGSRQSMDRVGVSRTAQQRHGGNLYDRSVNVTVPPADGYSQNGLPAGSGTATRTYGPYTPVYGYGVEYIYLNMLDQWGTFWLPEVTHNPIITNSVPGYAVAVYVYPNQPNAQYQDSSGSALGSTIYQGNAPKIQVNLTRLYPAGTTWVQFYQGTPSNPLSTVRIIPGTQGTAKATDLDTRVFNADLSSVIIAPGTWTVETIQRCAGYPDDHLQSATFTVNNKMNVNTELGSLK